MEIEEKERKWMLSRMILQFFSRMIEPWPLRSEVHKLKLWDLVGMDCTNETVKDREILKRWFFLEWSKCHSKLWDLGCIDSRYETMRDIGIAKKMKFLLNNMITILMNDLASSDGWRTHTGFKCAHYYILHAQTDSSSCLLYTSPSPRD